MSRPRNNLDELQRKHAQSTVSSPTKPATPQTGGGKVSASDPGFSLPFDTSATQAKFKPAKSVSSSTPATSTGTAAASQPIVARFTSHPTVKRLGSWSTPGFNKNKPPPLNCPSAADNSISYVDVSSTETVSVNTSTSSIPTKRLSSGGAEDLFPHVSPPKRPKTDHVPDKENVFRSDPKGKGKGRARDPADLSITTHTPSHNTLPSPHIQIYPPAQRSRTSTSLRIAFEGLTHDADLPEVWSVIVSLSILISFIIPKKSEDELRGVCNTANELSEVCNKLIGAARLSPDVYQDIEFLTVLRCVS